MTTPIPEPPGLPILGNLLQIDVEVPMRGFEALAKEYGEIYRLRIFGELDHAFDHPRSLTFLVLREICSACVELCTSA
jgi:hypothetical protein